MTWNQSSILLASEQNRFCGPTDRLAELKRSFPNALFCPISVLPESGFNLKQA